VNIKPAGNAIFALIGFDDISINVYQGTGKLVEQDGKLYSKICNTLFDVLELIHLQQGREKAIEITNDPIEMIRIFSYRARLDFKSSKEFDTFIDFLSKKTSFNVGSLKDTPGVTKCIQSIRDAIGVDFYDKLSPLQKAIFKAFAESGNKTIENVKVSQVFNNFFAEVKDEQSFLQKVELLSEKIMKKQFSNSKALVTQILQDLPNSRDLKKTALKKKSTGAFNKIMDDLDFVKIDEKLYPLTHAAVYSGDIPLGTFFRKSGESYFVYNDNWSLWEEMLKEYREIAIQIASGASGRTTYEKDIMSYFYFVLHELPEYLESHTGKKWKGIPKLVNSANELDPPKEGDNGVAKTRSALTPIVDNENSTVIVPYVSMQIYGGYGTTYCYGLNYSVLKRGFSFMGNVVTKDIEEKLNGRDDYGLMFYTLTGTAQGRGYPTFLIIFERLENHTRVHFHRTHPMRSKGGDYNPIHNWTIGCYKWMIGNVNFERIKAQQGDLAFVEIEGGLDFTSAVLKGKAEKVNSYDSHCFSEPVLYMPYEKKDKQNVLGYVRIHEPGVFLNHTEHLNRGIMPGDYEIRQCRSWEANPKGIWSLRID
jgi:hypothetical protein